MFYFHFTDGEMKAEKSQNSLQVMNGVCGPELGTPPRVPEPTCLSNEPVTAATVERTSGPAAGWLLWHLMQ